MEEAKRGLEVITRYFTDFSERQLEQLKQLELIYANWNQQINVISRKDIEYLYEKHILHSLSIAAVFSFRNGGQVIDVGTGGGFPGIPLAIYFPDTRFHLVDSIGKKLKVVQAAVDALELKNVTIQHGRAEEIRGTRFDCVVSRAVAPLKDLWKWSVPLLKKYKAMAPDPENDMLYAHGLVCLKGGDLAAEIAESNTRPRVFEIQQLFTEETFRDKFILYIPLG
jgi:16S rRNA (guanine527-N7)-methyltransferase